MTSISYSDIQKNLIKKEHGFFIEEIPADCDSMGVVRIRLEKEHYRNYPKEGFSRLTTDMIVMIVEGKIWYYRFSEVRRYFLQPGDVVVIPKLTDYSWEVESEYVILLAVNSPPFNPQDRKA